MQTYFESELEKLKKRILKMFNLAGNQLEKAFQILMNKQIESFEMIKDDENRIDKMDIKIDLICQKLFALSQPVASDLRFIMGSLGLSNEIERIGDMAYDLTKNKNIDEKFVEFLSRYDIPNLLEQIKKLYNQVVEAHINSNSQLASEIIQNCKNLRHYKEILNEIAAEMINKSEIVLIATDLIVIVNKLERITGHIENIAESIVFIVDGKIVKHPNLETKNQ